VADISGTLPEVQNSGVIGGDHYQAQLLGLSLIPKTIPQLRKYRYPRLDCNEQLITFATLAIKS
jgi:hypothetical protein